MLSGIKTVKRVAAGSKRKEQQQSTISVVEEAVTKNDLKCSSSNKTKRAYDENNNNNGASTTNSSTTSSVSKEKNVAAAQELRRLLVLSSGLPIQSKGNFGTMATTTRSANVVTRAEDDVIHEKSDVSQLVDQHTERLLQKFATAAPGTGGISPTTTATTNATNVSASSKSTTATSSSLTVGDSSSSNMTIEQLRREERTQLQTMDEMYARNIARLGSRYKNTDFATGSSSSIPETEYDIGENIGTTTMFTSSYSSKKKHRGDPNPSGRNSDTTTTSSRDYYKKQPKYSSTSSSRSSWWWFPSLSFRKHTLLAIGNHMSLVLAPSQESLVEGHCYLVPHQPTESFLSCIDHRQQVWEEVERFQTSLRTMFWQTYHQHVIFCEMTVAGQQARMDVIPCSSSVQHDAPLYFHTSFVEQQQKLVDDDEDNYNSNPTSTTTKLYKITPQQRLTQLPFRKRNNEIFPYAYVEWSMNEGYAQIMSSNTQHTITTTNKQRWLLDTMAAMLNVEPIRSRKQQHHNKEEQKRIADEKVAVWNFLQKWKSYDWTDTKD